MSTTEEINADFGRWCARHRKAAGLSQRQLGAAMCMDPSAITRIERGERRALFSEAVLLSEILRAPLPVPNAGPACTQCWDAPPAGFTCNACGLAMGATEVEA